jgi:hypothetical protein
MTSAAIHHVCSTFQPPLSGGSFLARTARPVDQSIALRSTVKPAAVSSSRVTSAAALRKLMSVMWTTVIGRPS